MTPAEAFRSAATSEVESRLAQLCASLSFDAAQNLPLADSSDIVVSGKEVLLTVFRQSGLASLPGQVLVTVQLARHGLGGVVSYRLERGLVFSSASPPREASAQELEASSGASASADATLVTHSGSCHCGRVRFEARAPAHLTLLVCNCSMCSRSGYRHLIVPADRFALVCGADSLTTYRFNTGTAQHLFCRVCGIKAFYVPRSHPDGFSVNANCIDPGTVTGTTLREVDGRNWEAQFPDGRGRFDD